MELDQALRSQLHEGEELLWSGAPEPGLHLQPGDGVRIPFSLAWCGFALFWEFSVVTSGAPFLFPVFGAFFVAAGLYFVFGRYIHAAWLAAGTRYAVTSRRVLILTRKGVRSLYISKLPCVERREKRNGLGTIFFQNPELATQFHYKTRFEMLPQIDAFVNIRDCERVCRLIESLMAR